MEQRKLGANGPWVGGIGFGAMSFGGIFGATTTEESLKCMDAVYDAGIDFIDTANVYGMGISESLLGQWLASRKAKVAIATKASFENGPPRRVNNSEAHLRAELEGSLKRLGRDHVELFYIHRREHARPLQEVIETLAKFVKEGLIGGYGLSEVGPSTIRDAHAIHPVTAVQNEYSLWSRQPELGVIRACKDLGIAFVPFSPLGRGMFGDTPLSLADVQDVFRGVNPRFMEPNFSRNVAAIDKFRDFARARGWSTPAAALAWVLQKGDHLIPIPGTRKAENLSAWLAAPTIRFTDEDWAEIDRILPAGFAWGDRYGQSQLLEIETYYC